MKFFDFLKILEKEKISFGLSDLLWIKIKSAPALEYDSALFKASLMPFPRIKLSILAPIKKSLECLALTMLLIFWEKFLIESCLAPDWSENNEFFF